MDEKTVLKMRKEEEKMKKDAEEMAKRERKESKLAANNEMGSACVLRRVFSI